MLKPINHHHHPLNSYANSPPSTTASSTTTETTSNNTDTDESPPTSFRHLHFKTNSPAQTHKSLAVLKGHVGSVSSLSLCGEFILSASQAKDIIVWQRPRLNQFTKFGHGQGSVKAVVTFGNTVFTAHQDSKIRVWKVSKSSENVFRLLDTLPTKKDYLGKFMKQSNYVQTRRHHKLLWIEHADSISCLAVTNGLIYSGSWDKTLKIWRISDFKCLESIKAHDDAINSLVASDGVVYSASADGKIKAWGKEIKNKTTTHVLKGVLEGHENISFNSVVVTDDGRLVYGGGSDGYIIGWLKSKDLDRWKMVCEVKAHDMSVLCMCLTGDFLLSGSADKSICVWKREVNGGLFKYMEIRGHEGPVKCLQAAAVRGGGGFMVYSGSLDKSVRVWWVPNYKCDEDDHDHDDDESSSVGL